MSYAQTIDITVDESNVDECMYCCGLLDNDGLCPVCDVFEDEPTLDKLKYN